MSKQKYQKVDPYAAIQHRVMDSPNYSKLKASSKSLLLVFARQLNGKNNGQLIATFSFVSKYDAISKSTLSRDIKELLHYKFIFQTKTGGKIRGLSKFAVTWLPIQDKTDVYVTGFELCPWRTERTFQDVKRVISQDVKLVPNIPPYEKTQVSKEYPHEYQNDILTPPTSVKLVPVTGVKPVQSVLIPIRERFPDVGYSPF